MEQLRQDIKASQPSNSSSGDGKAPQQPSSNGEDGQSANRSAGHEADSSQKDGNGEEDDTSNLAFISPLVDGRLVDIARQKS